LTEHSKKPGAIAALAGARAFPPLMIVLFHFSEGHHYSGVHWLDLIATRGYLWVEFFFALSGFILTYAYWPRLPSLLQAQGYGAFLRARLIRLYPLHLFTLLLMGVMILGARALAHAGGYISIYDTPYHPFFDTRSFFLNLGLVQAWNTLDRLSWNGVAWFVSVEFALCLLFPLLLWLAEGRLWRGFALIGTGLAGLVALLFTSAHGLDITFHNGVLRGLADFTIGIGMGVLYRDLKPRDRLPEWVHSILQLAVLGLLVLAVFSTGWSHTVYDIFTVLPLLALVLVLSFDRGVVARALQTPLPQTLGEWSYAIYLGQTTWLQGMRIIEQRFYPAPDAAVLGTRFSTLMWWLEPAALVLVCTIWGGLLAELVEIPAARTLKTWLGRTLDRSGGLTPS
jgi:peptidoglycan/LPS O-acetylase OafA/YrhL